jgi:DNA helicase-2/ATP-dependent DNA helicase PcrA
MKYDEFIKQAETLNLNAKDGIVCRNNAPLVSLAFALIRQGIGCRIEGRDIGQNLITLCNKWKRVSNLDVFSEKLHAFFAKEFDKATNAKRAMLEDKLDTMLILIERCQSLGKNDTESLKRLIEDMFTDNGDVKNANVVTLSSIHKAKGLEFENCWALGNNQFIPSKYANTDAAKEQETNLLYISVTRAINKLVLISDIPTRKSDIQED